MANVSGSPAPQLPGAHYMIMIMIMIIIIIVIVIIIIKVIMMIILMIMIMIKLIMMIIVTIMIVTIMIMMILITMIVTITIIILITIIAHWLPDGAGTSGVLAEGPQMPYIYICIHVICFYTYPTDGKTQCINPAGMAHPST